MWSIRGPLRVLGGFVSWRTADIRNPIRRPRPKAPRLRIPRPPATRRGRRRKPSPMDEGADTCSGRGSPPGTGAMQQALHPTWDARERQHRGESNGGSNGPPCTAPCRESSSSPPPLSCGTPSCLFGGYLLESTRQNDGGRLLGSTRSGTGRRFGSRQYLNKDAG